MELKVQTPQQNLGTPPVAEVVSDIAQMLKRLQRNVVIGISGRGGAGKSTVVEELRTKLYDWSVEPLVLHVDDFVFPKAVRDANPDRAKARYYESYDFATLFDRVLRPMKNSASYVAEVPVLDRAEDRQVTRRIAMSGPNVVLIEGVQLFRRAAEDIFDRRIWIEVPFEVGLQRALARQNHLGVPMTEKQKRCQYVDWSTAGYLLYEKLDAPRERAHIIIDGSKPWY